jgi:predicted enzyme related to lactoylglutathione lyase
MANKVEWFEVLGKDAGKLRGFYGELFQWKFEVPPDPEMDYGMTKAADTGIGGGVGKAKDGKGWVTFYVGVQDIEATIKRAEKLGAKVVMPVTKMPDITIATIADPEGHVIGLVQGMA